MYLHLASGRFWPRSTSPNYLLTTLSSLPVLHILTKHRPSAILMCPLRLPAPWASVYAIPGARMFSFKTTLHGASPGAHLEVSAPSLDLLEGTLSILLHPHTEGRDPHGIQCRVEGE